MSTIGQHLQAVRRRIDITARDCGRDSGSVTLLAVSKTRTVGEILETIACGQRHFGENYLQEAQPKIAALRDANLIWHFIGPVQSNKTRLIARDFSWVHSVDRLRIAHRLSEQRPPGMPPLQLCLQVNISRDPNKSGFAEEDVTFAAEEIARLPNITLRGLMALPSASVDPTLQRAPFAKLRHLQETLSAQIPTADTLSMGMSGDLEAAVAEGSTIVRVGTDIFGPRKGN